MPAMHQPRRLNKAAVWTLFGRDRRRLGGDVLRELGQLRRRVRPRRRAVAADGTGGLVRRGPDEQLPLGEQGLRARVAPAGGARPVAVRVRVLLE